MIADDISGSDIANEMGWNETSMLIHFSDFVCQEGLEELWLDFLNQRAQDEKDG